MHTEDTAGDRGAQAFCRDQIHVELVSRGSRCEVCLPRMDIPFRGEEKGSAAFWQLPGTS